MSKLECEGPLRRNKSLSGWHITIDDGYCAYRYLVDVNSRHSISSLMVKIKRICKTAPKRNV